MTNRSRGREEEEKRRRRRRRRRRAQRSQTGQQVRTVDKNFDIVMANVVNGLCRFLQHDPRTVRTCVFPQSPG